MRPLNSESSPSSEVRLWKSPIPYLFGGLGLLLLLISVALVILLCSYTKRPSHSSEQPEEEEEGGGGFKLQVMPRIECEPKILVIMAGDDNPTCLAKPIVPLTYCTCQPQPTPPPSSSVLATHVQKLTN